MVPDWVDCRLNLLSIEVITTLTKPLMQIPARWTLDSHVVESQLGPVLPVLTLHSCCQAEEGQEPFWTPEVVQEGQGEAAGTANTGAGARLCTLEGTTSAVNTGAGASLRTLDGTAGTVITGAGASFSTLEGTAGSRNTGAGASLGTHH